jgi:hypothetical protein
VSVPPIPTAHMAIATRDREAIFRSDLIEHGDAKYVEDDFEFPTWLKWWVAAFALGLVAFVVTL